MPFFMAPMARAALTVNGDTTGYATVADATPFYPGARVWLNDSDSGPTEYIITEIATGNKIGLRLFVEGDGGARYGRSDLSAFTTVNGAAIDQERQVVAVEWDHQKLNRP